MNKRAEKKVIIAVLLAIALVSTIVVATTVVQYTKVTRSGEVIQTTITPQQATLIASAQISGQVGEAELSRENGVLLYAVEIEKDDTEFTVKIDPNTGQVLSISQETEVGSKEVERIQAKISESQAKAAALAAVPGTVTDLEIEKVDGVYVYEVEITHTNGKTDVLVDLLTGNVLVVEEELEEENEMEDDDNKRTSASTASTATSSTGKISKSQAIGIAQDEVGSNFDLEEVDTGRFQGEEVWEVEFEDGNEEAEVKVDMATGRILDVEYETDDD